MKKIKIIYGKMSNNSILFIDASEGRILNDEELTELCRIIKLKMSESAIVMDNKLFFPEISNSQDSLDEIVSKLILHIREKSIIREFPDNLIVKHRIFHFEIIDDKIQVRFSEIGKYNFSRVINFLETDLDKKI